MKRFTTNSFWRHSSNVHCSDVSLDHRLTVGSPSGFNANSLLKLVSVLVLVLAFGVGNAWGTQVTSTFTSTSLGVGSGQPTWTSSATATAFENNRGVSWSKKSTNLTNSSLSSNTITSVVVTASANGSGGNITVTVGGTSFSSNNASISNGDNNATHTFTHSGATGNIVIGLPAGGKSIWVKSIAITYTSASCTATPTIGVVSLNGSFNLNH